MEAWKEHCNCHDQKIIFSILIQVSRRLQYIGSDSFDAQFSSLLRGSSDGIVVLEEGERPPGRHLRHDQDNKK